MRRVAGPPSAFGTRSSPARPWASVAPRTTFTTLAVLSLLGAFAGLCREPAGAGHRSTVPPEGRSRVPALRAAPAALPEAPPHAGKVLRRRPELPPLANGADPVPAPGSTAPESEISGVVLDAIGGPIAGARISARAAEGNEPGMTSLSADAGEFRLRLPVGSWQLRVEAEGYARTLQQLYSPAADVRLVLSPESAILGRVVSRAHRQPVAGVMVTAKKSDSPPYTVATALSDETGAFELRQLPAGTHHLLALSPHLRGERVRVELGVADDASGIELEVTSATTLRGEIRAGAAECAGTLELSGPVRLSSAADRAGRLKVQGLLPGSYEVTVTCPAALPFRERLVVGDSPISRSWQLEAGIVVRGSVETAAGRPLADAVITWTRREEGTQAGAELGQPALESSCVSDVHGEFACSGLAPGHYGGALHVRGQLQSAAPELHVPSSSAPPRMLLRADPSGTIRVHVEGTRAPGASIAVFACTEQGEPVLAQRDGQGFLLEGLPLGTYGIHLGAPECSGGSDVPVQLERDEQVAEVALALPRLARVRGRLVDERGAPVPDAWVRASDVHPAWARLIESAPAVMTDAEGEFRLLGLLPGRYDLIAHGTYDAGTARKSVALGPGDELDLRLVLDPPTPSENPSAPPAQRRNE